MTGDGSRFAPDCRSGGTGRAHGQLADGRRSRGDLDRGLPLPREAEPALITSGSPSASCTRVAGGPYGFFECYESLADLTRADFLSEAGKRTSTFVRFSTVAGSRGSADTVRDVRGFATRFYTRDGNFEIVGNNMPVFFIQDGIKFPDCVHAVKPEPHNEIPQASSAHNTLWDFVSLQPETIHMMMWLMSDRALPPSYRMMQGFGVHTFRLVNAEGRGTFVKWHWRPALGTPSLVWDETQKIAGKDPDFNRRDLWEAIESGNSPSTSSACNWYPRSASSTSPSACSTPPRSFGSPLRLGVTRAGQSPECPAPSRVLGDSSDLEGCAPLERLLPCPFRPPSMAGGRRPLAATSLHHKHRGGSTGEADRKPPCSGGTNRRVPTHVAVEPRASCAGPRCQARATRPASGATAGVVSAASHPQMTRSPDHSRGRGAAAADRADGARSQPQQLLRRGRAGRLPPSMSLGR